MTATPLKKKPFQPVRFRGDPEAPPRRKIARSTLSVPGKLLHADRFIPYLPMHATADHLIKLSYKGRFPRAIRVPNQKSVPLWEAGDLIKYVREHFASAMPEAVAEFETAVNKMTPCKAGKPPTDL